MSASRRKNRALSYGAAWFMMPASLLISFITDRKPMNRKASMNNYAITDTRCCCSS
jgi:beta-lactamase regulating signal transducer with metallopeptidase domain